MTMDTDCFSFHVAPPQPDHMRLVWQEPHKAEDMVRVTAYTCDCKDKVYELCHAAGHSFIRRTRRRAGATQVHETYRWLRKETQGVWIALLEGRAR